MKRALLIAGGALGGLGAVMAITPPQFSSTESLALGGPAIAESTQQQLPHPQQLIRQHLLQLKLKQVQRPLRKLLQVNLQHLQLLQVVIQTLEQLQQLIQHQLLLRQLQLQLLFLKV